jgi:hypothetical protein
MNILGLAPFFLEEGRGVRKFRSSKCLCIYSAVMLLIFLCSKLAMIIEKLCNDNMDDVDTFATTMKRSADVISHSCFLFSTLVFRCDVIKLVYMLLSFCDSTYYTFTSFENNFNYLFVLMCVLVTLYILSAFLIFLGIEMKKVCVNLCLYHYCCVSFVGKCSKRVVHKLSRVIETVFYKNKRVFMWSDSMCRWGISWHL